MAGNTITAGEAETLYRFILERLREEDLRTVAEQIEEVADTGVLEYKSVSDLSNIAQRDRASMSKKSVRVRDSFERLRVALDLFASRLQTIPRVSAAAKERLGVQDVPVYFRPDPNAVEGTLSDISEERSETEDLDALQREPSAYPELALLWRALSPEVEESTEAEEADADA